MELIKACDILKNHFIDGEFVRCDFFARLLAIDNYYGKNNFGISIYNKIQKNKIARPFLKNKTGFVHLIESFRKNGFIYEENNSISLNRFGRLSAGAHRFVCCLYYGIKEIPCVYNGIKDTKITISWFKDKKFTDNTIKRIVAKQIEVLDGCL